MSTISANLMTSSMISFLIWGYFQYCSHSWRTLIRVADMLTLLVIACLRFIPETPRFLYDNDMTSELLDCFDKMSNFTILTERNEEEDSQIWNRRQEQRDTLNGHIETNKE